MMTNPMRTFCCAAITVALGVAPAIGGEPDALIPVGDPPAGDEWEIIFRPYLWTANLDGTSAVNGIQAPVDVSFEDLFDALDFTWASTQEIRRKGSKWGFMLDTFYAKLKPDVSAPIDSLTIEQAIIDPVVFYRAIDSERGWLDLGAGVRWNYLSLDIDTVAGIGADGSDGWWDPHFGFRFRYNFNDRIHVIGLADIGGFDVGSDLTYQLAVAMGYHINDRFEVEGGVRYLSVDYSDGDFLYDVDTTGIFLGLAISF